MSDTRTNWPIIVGGVERSGTSLVRRILNAHSRIYCGPEVKFFKEWHRNYINVSDPINHVRFIESARAMLPDEELQAIIGQAFIEMHQHAARRENKPRWADKNPENVLYLHEWNALLGEEWLFVHIVRNPLDTLASIDEANFKYSIPSDLEGRIGHYRRYTEAGMSYSKLHPNRSYRLIYERLATSPEVELERLMQWLGEAPEKEQLNFNAFHHQPGLEDPKVGTTQKVHSDSVGRWVNRFTATEIHMIMQKTGELWNEIDYGRTYPLERVQK